MTVYNLFKFGKVLEPNPNNPLQASYANIPVIEHIGSRIFEAIGIPSQKTILGTYRGRPVVACRDFIADLGDQYTLVEYASLETSVRGGSSSGRTASYENLTKILSSHKALDTIRTDAVKRYWDTFIIDALIGNFDRHAGNWGYIIDKANNTLVKFSARRSGSIV